PDSAKAAASNMVSEALNAAPVQFGYQYKVPSDVLRKEHPRPYRLIFDNWADELYLKELFDSPRPWLPQWDSPWLTAAARNSRVSRPIREALVRENWAIRDGAWLAMHPKVFWVYMCVLAKLLADRNNLLPVTDQVVAHAVANGWTPDRIIAALGDSPLGSAANE